MNKKLLIILSLITAFFIGQNANAQEMKEGQASKETTLAVSEKPLAGYDDGFFLRSSDDLFKLKIGGRFEGRFTYTSPDAAADTSNFSIPRARLILSGNVFTKDLKYKFQTEFGKGSPQLLEYYADYNFIHNYLALRIGQFQKPLSRDQLTGSTDLMFTELSIANMGVGSAYDIGLMLHNSSDAPPMLEYQVGFFNDTGVSPTLTGKVETKHSEADVLNGTLTDAGMSNVPKFVRPGLAARLAFNSDSKMKPYSELDFEGGSPRVSFGASSHLSFCGVSCVPGEGGQRGTAVGRVDWMLKAYHLTLIGAGTIGFAQKEDSETWDDMDLAAASFAWQAGYLIQDVVQPAFRYAIVDYQDTDARTSKALQKKDDFGRSPLPADVRHEIGPAVDVLLYKQKVQWKTDFTVQFFENDAGNLIKDYQLRTQVGLSF